MGIPSDEEDRSIHYAQKMIFPSPKYIDNMIQNIKYRQLPNAILNF